MTYSVKRFIEKNIDLIEDNNFDELFNIVYDQLINVQISQLINTLNQAGCDMKKYAIEFFQKLINQAISEAFKEINPREDQSRFRETIEMKLYLITTLMEDIGLSDEEKQQIFERMVWGYEI